MIPPFEQLQTDQPENNLFLILFSLASLLAFFVEGLLVVHSSVGTDIVIWVASVFCVRLLIKTLHVAQMRITYFTGHFGARHAIAAVHVFFHIVRVQRGKITGPAAACIKFGVRREQWGAATNTAVNTRLMVVPILTCEGTFGAFFAGYLKTGRGQFLAPLGFCF